MKKRLKFLFIVFIQLIFLSNVFAIENGKVTKFEPHTKGINISAVLKDFNKQDLTIEYIDKRFNYGEQFDCLTALNVKGGKALVPIYKYLARPELTPAGLVQTGLDNITMEV